MNNKINKIFREQETINQDNIFYTVNRETGKLLHLLVKSKNPKNVLEIGTSIGYSTIWLASALKNGKLITLERLKERADIARKFFKKAKLNIKLIEGDALKTIPKTKFDVVFLDATKSEYLKYLKKVKFNKNALVIADNTISHASKMKDFLDYVNKRGAVNLDIGSGIVLYSR